VKITRRTALLSTTAAMLGAAAATPASAQKAADQLRILFNDAVPNVDMYFNSQRTGLILAHQAWDMLVHRDPATFEIKPSLATDWKFTDDNTLDLTIRQGVKFHDGSTLSPDDVVYTINMAADPALQGRDPLELQLDRQGREDRRLDGAHQDEAADAGGARISRHGDADPSQGLSREGRPRGLLR
jgi:ABC-type transport system substrate-binding protein